MEMTVSFIPLCHSGLRQNPKLTANFDMFKLTIFIVVGHQRTILHVVNVGGHTDVRIAITSALVHHKFVRNGRKCNDLTHIGQNGCLQTISVISGITALTKFDS